MVLSRPPCLSQVLWTPGPLAALCELRPYSSHIRKNTFLSRSSELKKENPLFTQRQDIPVTWYLGTHRSGTKCFKWLKVSSLFTYLIFFNGKIQVPNFS